MSFQAVGTDAYQKSEQCSLSREKQTNFIENLQRRLAEIAKDEDDEEEDAITFRPPEDNGYSLSCGEGKRSCPSPADNKFLDSQEYTDIIRKPMSEWTSEQVAALCLSISKDEHLEKLCRIFEIDGNLFPLLLKASDLLALNSARVPLFSVNLVFDEKDAEKFLEVKANILQKRKQFHTQMSTEFGSPMTADSVKTTNSSDSSGTTKNFANNFIWTESLTTSHSTAAIHATMAVIQTSGVSLAQPTSSLSLSVGTYSVITNRATATAPA